MADQTEVQPIIIIKKKGGHGGHHGGAWKVAYADFVTAMMAFFMVMWLLNAGTKVREAVAGYFNDPVGFKGQIGTGAAGAGEGLSITAKDVDNLKGKLEKAMAEMPQFQEMKDQVKFTVTGEGLRIELLETENGMFFTSGSALPSPQGKDLLSRIAKELGTLENTLLIEGHTDSKPFSGEGYTNWELSADRANAARKVMQAAGVRPDQVMQVRGFAAQHLFKRDDPQHASNRRVSLIVQYKNKPEETSVEEKPGDAHGKDAHGKEPAKDSHAKDSHGKDSHAKEPAKDSHAPAKAAH
ncbi:MAG: flagellar motor protein MotB [Bryobacteraceae bacterium]|nr:flagellar motor protein MotB [Bryobacteraceae bacterium]